jgi:hypothetical protein
MLGRNVKAGVIPGARGSLVWFFAVDQMHLVIKNTPPPLLTSSPRVTVSIASTSSERSPRVCNS